MQDIWDDHHRQIRELDRIYKKNIRITIAVGFIIFIAFVIVLYKY